MRYTTVPSDTPSVTDSAWLMTFPEPLDAPVTFVALTTVQVKTVPATALGFVIVMSVVSPLHIPLSSANTSGIGLKRMVTSLVLTHKPLVIVQRNTYVCGAMPSKSLSGSVGSAKIPPVALTTDHSPVPMTGVLAASVVEVPHNSWLGPATATVGCS